MDSTTVQALRVPTPPAAARIRLRHVLWIVSALAALYVLWMLIAICFQERMIFPGTLLPHPAAPGPTDPAVEQLWLTHGEQRIEAWFKAGQGRSAASPGPAVLYFHGNLDLLDERWLDLAPYIAAGLSLMAMEYRGYGRLDGLPTQDALVADGVLCFDLLRARPEVLPDKIVLHGLSIGAAIATQVGLQRRPGALVLESAFYNMSEMANRMGLPGFLLRHPFRNDLALPRLDVPVILFHGRNDGFVSPNHSQRLHALTPGSRLVLTDGGHDNHKCDWESIMRFLEEHGLKPNP